MRKQFLIGLQILIYAECINIQARIKHVGSTAGFLHVFANKYNYECTGIWSTHVHLRKFAVCVCFVGDVTEIRLM